LKEGGIQDTYILIRIIRRGNKSVFGACSRRGRQDDAGRELGERVRCVGCIAPTSVGPTEVRMQPGHARGHQHTELGAGGSHDAPHSAVFAMGGSLAHRNARTSAVLRHSAKFTIKNWIMHPIPASRRLLGRWRRQR
jgi:hypothetical protein